jgi:hypothetical protein
MLGPGMILIGSPLAFGYSLHARTSAPDRGFAYAALGLSAVELLAFLLLAGSVFLTLLNSWQD